MTVNPRDILIISRIPGVGPNRLRALLTRFGDASALATAPARSLRRIEGIEEKTAASITSFFRSGAAYPPSLRTIYDPPPLLFVRGTLREEDSRSIAVVGTRRASPYGILMAERFATALAQVGLPVVSGLARGIDSAAHAASVK